MAVMTATTMATWLPEKWSARATVTYRSNTVLESLVDRGWEPELGAGMGDTVNIPGFSQNSGAVARSTFGTVASLDTELIATTETQTQIVVNKMGIYGYELGVETKLQAMPGYFEHLNKGIGTALALYADAQLGSDNSNGIDGFSTAVGTDNVDVTEDDIITCRVNLDNNNAPLDNRVCVISPATLGSLLKIDVFRNSLYGRSTGNLDANKGAGYLGRIHTFDFYESNNLEAGSSGKKNGAFQKEAIALIVQQKAKIVNDLEISTGLANFVVGYIVFGHKMVKNNHGNELDGK